MTINHAPQEKFQYVKILSLNDLFGYITSQDVVFSENQINELTNFLTKDKIKR